MKNIYLSLGSNIGNRENQLFLACKYISNHDDIFLLKCSKIYQTSPVSNILQPFFLNMTCHIKSNLPIKKIFMILEELERKLGKTKKKKTHPRCIDIDILFVDSVYYHDSDIIIPHPKWQERLFVLKPLSDILTSITLISNDGTSRHYNLNSLIENFKNLHNESCAFYSNMELL